LVLGVSVTGSSKAYVKAAGSVPPDPPGFVTTTSAGPAARAGTIAVMVVLLTTLTLTALISTVTVAPTRNPVPLIVTDVGRAVEPVEGEIAVTLGELGALGAAGGIAVGPDGERPSQAADPIARANSNTPRRILVVLVILFSESRSGKRRGIALPFLRVEEIGVSPERVVRYREARLTASQSLGCREMRAITQMEEA
jgi:hypothetical protein